MIVEFLSAGWVALLPLLMGLVPIGAMVLFLGWPRRRQLLNIRRLWILISIVAPLIILYGVFGALYFYFHDGLPTGDVQKAIFWGQKIIAEHRLPDYESSFALLNRDPVDFYTPGLHAFTALALAASPQPLISIGLLAIVVALATAWVAALLARELLPDRRIWPAVLTAGLLLTQLRFLRYLREPGYHWQNVVGELLMFSLLYLGIRLLKKWDWRYFIVAVALAICLALSHQFSTFIAFFMLAPLAFVFINQHRHVAAISAIGLIIGGASLGLHQKLPHLFTSAPHLLSDVPMLPEYFMLMGPVWLTLGLVGLILLVRHQPAFAAGTGILLLLTQGPRFGIDIPPVRTLFYLAVPLSITGAYAIERLSVVLGRWRYILFFVIALAMTSSFRQAFTLSHTVRTNSTLTAEEMTLIDYVKSNPEGTLIDDYNRRSASWLLLSGSPTFSRLAADISRQMSEVGQSEARRQLYLEQLDFEKIFSLGSLPEISELLDTYDIHYVTGIDNSSNSSFRFNPILAPVRRADDITLYAAGQGLAEPRLTKELTSWLLRPTTLANDIGDDEDTFEHLPASLRVTRLSGPLHTGSRTYRETSAPLIPLQFNVGDYAEVLWDQDHNHYPDGALDLLVNDTVRRIEADQALIDGDGFITIYIPNPQQAVINIDLIALGLARVP